MVKGISRQVIVVQSPDPKLFEQAIFILKEKVVAEGVTEEVLMKQAQQVLHGGQRQEKRKSWYLYGGIWSLGGAAAMGLIWLLTALVA